MMINEPFPTLPYCVSDLDGTLIYCNDAASEACAALAYGKNIFDIFPGLDEAVRRARAEGRRTLTLPLPDCDGDVIFDLSKEISDRVIAIYPALRGTDRKEVSLSAYRRTALEFLRLASVSGHEGSRRATELYDALLAVDPFFFRKRGLALYNLKTLLSQYFDSAVSSIRHIGHRLILRSGASVTDSALIDCDPYVFFLMLSSFASAVSYAARGDITIEAEHTGGKALITVGADIRRGITISDTSSFGVHAPDVLFAEVLAHASGCETSLDADGGRVRFSVSIRAGEYYSEYLKADVGETYILELYANAAARLISR